MKITDSRIAWDRANRWAIPVVYATIDGKEERLFEYYPDEIFFLSDEFIGLTREEALELRHKKDIAYLQS